MDHIEDTGRFVAFHMRNVLKSVQLTDSVAEPVHYASVDRDVRLSVGPEGIMVTVLSVLVFVGALVTAVSVIAMMVAPQWRRILHLASGHVEPAFTPLSQLVVAERRIAVRRWSSMSPAYVPVRQSRAAA